MADRPGPGYITGWLIIGGTVLIVGLFAVWLFDSDDQAIPDFSEPGQTIRRPDDVAREECSMFSIQQLAAEYGGTPADSDSVARAYACDTRSDGTSLQVQLAYQGCLAALLDKP